jgi:hypothetical protein
MSYREKKATSQHMAQNNPEQVVQGVLLQTNFSPGSNKIVKIVFLNVEVRRLYSPAENLDGRRGYCIKCNDDDGVLTTVPLEGEIYTGQRIE